MSFTTWISDPDAYLEDFTLCTKSKSYEFGRRLYRFQVAGQYYWLKYHQSDSLEQLNQSFLHELDFYRKHVFSLQDLILPSAIVPLEQFSQLNDAKGEGLVLLDAEAFFNPLTETQDCHFIQQKIMQALQVLEQLHQLKWIHGDLKTDHFRDYAQSCRLMDFEQSDVSRTKPSKIHATPHYMAPELFHGDCKSVQSDLYAFGVILYEWLTQKKLAARSYLDWAILHCQQLEIQLPQAFACFFPFLNGLLQKHTEQRFHDANEAKQVLKQLDLP